MKNDKVMFSIKLTVFLVILAIFCCFIVFPQYTTEYNAALLDKFSRLQTLDSPKIVIVGDSNAAYGFDCALIEEEIGMPVVNMGLHAGLGIKFDMDLVRNYIHKGDILVVVPHNYSDAQKTNYSLLWITIENHMDLWKEIKPERYYPLLKSMSTYIRDSLQLWSSRKGNMPIGETSYKSEAFNEYGDNAFDRPECIITDETYGGRFVALTLSEPLKLYWNEYNQFVNKQQAVLYMSAPPILDVTLTGSLEEVQKSLKALDCKVISNLEDYVYPIDYFYDTGLHLNNTGRVIRTKQLIKDLQRAM